MTKLSENSDVELYKSAISGRLRTLYPGVTEAEFSERIGISQASAHNYLSGKRGEMRGSTLSRIVNDTGCNANWLLTGDGEPFPRPHSDTIDKTHLAFQQLLVLLTDAHMQMTAGGDEKAARWQRHIGHIADVVSEHVEGEISRQMSVN